MSIERLFNDYHIEIAPEGDKHHRNGWLNIKCPMCNSGGFHLGFNLERAYFSCYRCGPHFVDVVLVKLLRISSGAARNLITHYSIKNKNQSNSSKANSTPQVRVGGKQFKFPSDTIPLGKPHIRYIEKRGFDPVEIEKLWGVLGTSPTSKLDKIPYGYRILLPWTWEGKVVTFQARDYTDKQEQRYMACPEIREIVHHKNILYGHPSLWEKGRGILVEGPLDVWRLGVNACATAGTGYTPQQVRLLTRLFKELYIIFDPEPIAQRVARQLQKELSFRGVKTYIYDQLKTDPGAMKQSEANKLLRELNF
jgi:hypothetical protein